MRGAAVFIEPSVQITVLNKLQLSIYVSKENTYHEKPITRNHHRWISRAPDRMSANADENSPQ